ncbi:photosystem I reaction center subunit II, chloroplastic [Lactuca sativa]|uniref:photosystem I reaction center subunit II, chloroplastic n=1 Tax=Lactuca sativa TaxID=4236 RepID=UPI000CA8A0D2|nr:photosystem I reaction center subunit II, chloroplastic [Lactuca sativa]
MATQASLFALIIPNQTSPWKQSQPISFNTVKPSKPTTCFTTIKVAATWEVPTKEALIGFIPPELDPNTSSPIFVGSTGGLLRKARVEEFYVITWNSPKE